MVGLSHHAEAAPLLARSLHSLVTLVLYVRRYSSNGSDYWHQCERKCLLTVLK